MTDEAPSRALESDQRLAAHLRALSRLAPTTAHDMRTPIHTVVLYLELLRNTLAEPAGGDVKERQGRYVEVIGSELQRLEGMLDSILDQLRVTEDSAERFDLAETVRDLGILLDPYCRRGRVELRRGSDGPVHVQGNKDSLKQALLHILITSVEAVPADSPLSISVFAENGGAVVRVAGALPAIPSALLPGNEDPGDTTETERGLRVARRVVERHGGSIHARSGTSDAATLEIQLPLAAAKIG
jgi:two-component system sporulation sensor kinase B